MPQLCHRRSAARQDGGAGVGHVACGHHVRTGWVLARTLRTCASHPGQAAHLHVPQRELPQPGLALAGAAAAGASLAVEGHTPVQREGPRLMLAIGLKGAGSPGGSDCGIPGKARRAQHGALLLVVQQEGAPEAADLLQRHVRRLRRWVGRGAAISGHGSAGRSDASLNAHCRASFDLILQPSMVLSAATPLHNASACTHLVEPLASTHNLGHVGQADVGHRVRGDFVPAHVRQLHELRLAVLHRDEPVHGKRQGFGQCVFSAATRGGRPTGDVQLLRRTMCRAAGSHCCCCAPRRRAWP